MVQDISKSYADERDGDADWDGVASEWFQLNRGKPIKGVLLKDIVAGDITVEVSDVEAGTVQYTLGISEDLTSKSGDLAFFIPELAPFTWCRFISTGTQVDGGIKIVETS